MSYKPIFLASALLGMVPVVAISQQNLAPATTQNGITTQTAKASEAFPLLKGFWNIPTADRDQIMLGYVLKVKKAPASSVNISLTDQGKSIPITIGAGGRLSPIPTKEQMARGATVVIKGPKEASVSLKLKIYSTQGLKVAYDAKGLARGASQSNKAASKIAGVIAATQPKIDRVYFVGATSATVTTDDGKQLTLPVTATAGEYPASTPYFLPNQLATAKTIVVNRIPSAVMFDNAPKK